MKFRFLIATLATAALVLPAANSAAAGSSTARQACKAERAEDRSAFDAHWGKRAMRKCKRAAREVKPYTVRACRSELEAMGRDEFRAAYGTNRNGANAFGKCVKVKVRDHVDPEPDVGDPEPDPEQA